MLMSTEDLEKGKLDELLDLTRENNRILRAMHRKQVMGQIMTFFYWLVILGIAGWSYYLVQPYLMQYIETYQKAMKAINNLDEQTKSLPSNLQGLLDKVK